MLMVEVVLRNPKMAIAILAQGESLDTREQSETSPQTSQARKYMQDEEDQVVPRATDSYCDYVDTLVVSNLQSACTSLQEEGLGSYWWLPEARESLTPDRLAYCITEEDLVPKRARA